MIDETILHYKILEKLGEGGMGVVYKADDTKLKREVAIKFLPRFISTNEEERQRFEIEAQAAAALNHPNIAHIYAIEETDDEMFIVMELIDGIELKDRIKTGPIPNEEVINISNQLAEGLDAAHKKSIVHRDIKSSNIMITKEGKIKIMDFGLAKIKGGTDLTKIGSTVGTVAYMSPEQVRGEEVDYRSDIWSFGVVLYEMLAGQLPFKGDYEQAVLYSILNEEIKPIQKINPSIDISLQDILEKCLKKNPDDRFLFIHEIIGSLNVSGDLLKKYHLKNSEQKTLNMKSVRGSFFKSLWFVSLIIILIVSVWFIEKDENYRTKTPFKNTQISLFTTHGKTGSCSISKDGKYIAYVLEDQNVRSLWLNQVTNKSNVQIFSHSKNIRNVIFAPDDNHIYYRSYEGTFWRASTLFKIPVLGGTPIEVTQNVSGPISFSPDGKRIMFFRFEASSGKVQVIIADNDGSNETVFKTWENKQWTNSVIAWSPDGRNIAIHSQLEAGQEGIVIIDYETKQEHLLNAGYWGAVDQIKWLSDGQGILLSAAHKVSGFFFQIWYISYPEGVAQRVTNDPNNYIGLSLTGNDKSFITVKSDWTSNIWVVTNSESKKLKQLTNGKFDGFSGVAWTPEGHIVQGSREWEIWFFDKNGSNNRLISEGNKTNRRPDVSPDGNYVIYESWREEKLITIFEQSINGGPAKKLSDTDNLRNPQVSINDDWIVCNLMLNAFSKVVKLPRHGGDYIPLSENESWSPAISPDGKQVVFFQMEHKNKGDVSIAIVAIDGSDEEIFLKQIPKGTYSNTIRWSHDGKAISLIIDKDGISNIWNYPIDGLLPKQITFFDSQQIPYIMAFDWSSKGELLISRGKFDEDIVLISELDENL